MPQGVIEGMSASDQVTDWGRKGTCHHLKYHCPRTSEETMESTGKYLTKKRDITI